MSKYVAVRNLIGANVGMGIVEMVHDIEDSVIAEMFDGEDTSKRTKHKIYYNKSGRPYFVKFRNRYYLDEFIKMT